MPPEDDPRMDEQPTQEEWEAAMGKPAATGSGEPTYVPATPESEGPAQEPQMSEPTHKLPESLPYQMMIGDLRRCLFTRGDSAWNGYIRDMTAELEQAGEYVNVAEAFSRVNAKAAKMMGILEFQKAMCVPATPAPSQPAAHEFWIAEHRAMAAKTEGHDMTRCLACNGMVDAGQVAFAERFARQQTAAKDAEIESLRQIGRACADQYKRVEENKRLRSVITDLLMSADASWYERNAGHDWREAYDRAAALTPSPAQEKK